MKRLAWVNFLVGFISFIRGEQRTTDCTSVELVHCCEVAPTVVRAREGERTYGTLIGFIHCMRTLVFLQIARLLETFVAHIAHVRTLPRVYPHVILQMRGDSKALATRLTLVWLLSRMQSEVNVTAARVTKELTAHVTFVVLLVTVHRSTMGPQARKTKILAVTTFTFVQAHAL